MFSTLFCSGIAALVYAAAVNGLSSKAGSTVNVDGIFYYVPPTAVSILGVASGKLKVAATPGNDLMPMTVVTGDFTTFDSNSLDSIIANFTTKDDVFSTGFLQGTAYFLLYSILIVNSMNFSFLSDFHHSDRASCIIE